MIQTRSRLARSLSFQLVVDRDDVARKPQDARTPGRGFVGLSKSVHLFHSRHTEADGPAASFCGLTLRQDATS